MHSSLVCQVSSRRKDRKGNTTCMKIRNMHILVCVIHFQSLLCVVYLWLNRVSSTLCLMFIEYATYMLDACDQLDVLDSSAYIHRMKLDGDIDIK